MDAFDEVEEKIRQREEALKTRELKLRLREIEQALDDIPVQPTQSIAKLPALNADGRSKRWPTLANFC
ncbi:MAG: hypothetical protein WBB01_25030 [Phormidesmis sp.]